ncbi:unnamed protein product (macronuclear) [Paramecium tetraurelia]|uniref:Armadillo-type fold n=1 Tax=Paramecium tetraurelia TaxID=5888 RepID=A0DZ65_PARTE|nr:uncharacterized protein GSPATT00003301001 [Paramecium tetraurelia]CAK88332.1 unnamed protein product [Paramecium tetraurelia]|eukprot:XP_001455729.1 hypothetical protein (macronuclear) [Paramecium tetraurelia strain d4-2]
MLDYAGIISLKREQFHVNIRKQRNEKQFKESRKNYIQFLFSQQTQMQEMSNSLREKLEKGENLQGEVLQMMVDKIFDVLQKDNNLNLLDTIDAAVWMLKSVDEQTYEDELSDNLRMLKIVEKMILYSQGYEIDNEPLNSQIIIYAAKFLKYWTQMEDKSLNLKFGEMAETVYFLLSKQEQMFIKRGADILYNMALIDNGQILIKLHELLIFGQKLVNQFALSQIQVIIQRIVLQTFLDQDKNGQQLYINFNMIENQQQISFFNLLINQVLESEQQNRKLFKNQMHLVQHILDYYQSDNEQIYEEFKQLLITSQFSVKLKNLWLFHKWNSIATIAHEIQTHLEEQQL